MKAHDADIDITSGYTGIWYAISECHYTDCDKMVYGDDNSIIINRVFCQCHYDTIMAFLGEASNG